MAGNANSGRRRNTFVSDALIMEMKERENDGDKRGIRKLAVVLWDKAEEGDLVAATFIRDTIDGKPVQAIEGGLEHTLADPLLDLIKAVAERGKRLGDDT